MFDIYLLQAVFYSFPCNAQVVLISYVRVLMSKHQRHSPRIIRKMCMAKLRESPPQIVTSIFLSIFKAQTFKNFFDILIHFRIAVAWQVLQRTIFCYEFPKFHELENRHMKRRFGFATLAIAPPALSGLRL